MERRSSKPSFHYVYFHQDEYKLYLSGLLSSCTNKKCCLDNITGFFNCTTTLLDYLITDFMSISKAIFPAIFSFFLLSACNPAVKSKKEGNENEITNNEKLKDTMQVSLKWDVVAKGTQCAVQASKQLFVKNQADFDQLWKKSFEGIDIITEKPTINFAEKWVIAAFTGRVNTGGYDIEIKEIKATETEKMVFIKNIKPGTGCMTTAAEESPFLFATIAHFSTGNIGFTIINEEKKCE
jgi:hypothetical protein